MAFVKHTTASPSKPLTDEAKASMAAKRAATLGLVDLKFVVNGTAEEPAKRFLFSSVAMTQLGLDKNGLRFSYNDGVNEAGETVEADKALYLVVCPVDHSILMKSRLVKGGAAAKKGRSFSSAFVEAHLIDAGIIPAETKVGDKVNLDLTEADLADAGFFEAEVEEFKPIKAYKVSLSENQGADSESDEEETETPSDNVEPTPTKKGKGGKTVEPVAETEEEQYV